MNDDRTAADRLAEHRLRLQAAGTVPMTADEILSGGTQAGVPRPTFLSDHDDDGTVDFVDPLSR